MTGLVQGAQATPEAYYDTTLLDPAQGVLELVPSSLASEANLRGGRLCSHRWPLPHWRWSLETMGQGHEAFYRARSTVSLAINLGARKQSDIWASANLSWASSHDRNKYCESETQLCETNLCHPSVGDCRVCLCPLMKSPWSCQHGGFSLALSAAQRRIGTHAAAERRHKKNCNKGGRERERETHTQTHTLRERRTHKHTICLSLSLSHTQRGTE